MKKLISILAVSILLLSFASCSEATNESNQQKQTEATSIAQSTATTAATEDVTTKEQPTKTTAEISQKALKEITADNLDGKFDCGYYSFKYPKEWKLNTSEYNPNTLRLFINDDAYFSIRAEENKYFTDSFEKKPTNEDYIDYMSSHYGYYDKYVPEGSIGFVTTEEENEFYHSIIYRFYSYNLIFEIWFETEPGSDYYYSQNTIDKILQSFTLYDVSEPFSWPTNAQSSTTNTQPSTSTVQTASRSFTGSGDTVTDVFSADGCTRIKGEYTGDSIFVVNLYDSEGNLENFVFSSSGAYTGQKVFKFEEGKQYMFEVTARDGDWSITVE